MRTTGTALLLDSWSHRLFRACFFVLFSACLSCAGGGGGGGGLPFPEQGFSIQVSPSSLSIPSGGSGSVTVTVTRAFGQSGPVTLVLDQPPQGITLTGSIAQDATSGTVVIGVSPDVLPQTFTGLLIQGSINGKAQTAPLTLTVIPTTALLTPDQVQASGGFQAGGQYANAPLMGEPVQTTTITNSAGSVRVRPGFTPPVSSDK